jgi:ABC-2 type transport system ATP-binding protein
MAEMLVAAEGISKRYGRATAVEAVTLTLEPGQICGFVGANGGGKTTTLRMLAGILRPDAGQARILGFDPMREPSKIRERVGYMSQQLSLYGELSVYENLRFRAAVFGLKNLHGSVETAIDEYGLAKWARSPASALSGGWARRLQLAASLLHSPRLILLDEPTAGLDAAARHAIWQRIDRMAATGAGVIVSTHDFAEVERCSQIIFFAEGRVVAAGAPQDVARRSPVSAFLLSGIDPRRIAQEIAAVSGVIASYPEGGGLRVIADPLCAAHLQRFAELREASLARVASRIEDAIFAWSAPMSGELK